MLRCRSKDGVHGTGLDRARPRCCGGGGMSVKDRDSGRVRIHYTTVRESSVRSNRKILHMDEVERVCSAARKST